MKLKPQNEGYYLIFEYYNVTRKLRITRTVKAMLKVTVLLHYKNMAMLRYKKE